MHRPSLLLSSLLALLLTGCTVGPDYSPPEPELPEAFTHAEEGTTDPAPGPDTAWWSTFDDPLLNQLIEDALASNLELEAARARLDEARALRRATAGRGRPAVGYGANSQAFEGSENAFGPAPALARQGLAELEGESYDAGLEASWELDLFGGIRRSVEAAQAQVEMAEEGHHAVRLGVIAEVARAYFDLRGAQRRRALAEKNVGLLADTHRVVEVRAQVGLVSELDERRALAQVQTTRSLVPPIRAAERAAAHRLAVLTGRHPTALNSALLTPQPLTTAPTQVPVGLPSELLLRRPDLRLAERRLAAATAEIGVRTAALYPSFRLTGALGLDSGSFADLFEGTSGAWSLLAGLTGPLFQGGRLRAGIDAAEAQAQGAHADYRSAVLTALEDVENALVAYAEEELRRRQLEEAADAARRASELARVVYDKGLEDYLTVLDAERSLTELEDALAQSETGVLQRVVGLYAALGGGWGVEVGGESEGLGWGVVAEVEEARD